MVVVVVEYKVTDVKYKVADVKYKVTDVQILWAIENVINFHKERQFYIRTFEYICARL